MAKVPIDSIQNITFSPNCSDNGFITYSFNNIVSMVICSLSSASI
jgi:hypothetical protein